MCRSKTHHEAGHALACIALGVYVVSVDVVNRPELDRGGICFHESCGHRESAIICASGPLAEVRALESHPWEGGWSESDWADYIAEADKWAAERRFDYYVPDPIRRCRDDCYTSASFIVFRRWGDIQKLAWALDERQKLTGTEIENLLRN